MHFWFKRTSIQGYSGVFKGVQGYINSRVFKGASIHGYSRVHQIKGYYTTLIYMSIFPIKFMCQYYFGLGDIVIYTDRFVYIISSISTSIVNGTLVNRTFYWSMCVIIIKGKILIPSVEYCVCFIQLRLIKLKIIVVLKEP